MESPGGSPGGGALKSRSPCGIFCPDVVGVIDGGGGRGRCGGGGCGGGGGGNNCCCVDIVEDVCDDVVDGVCEDAGCVVVGCGDCCDDV